MKKNPSRNRRVEERFNKKKAELDLRISEEISSEYNEFAKAVMKSYQTRASTYLQELHKTNADLLKSIGYNLVELDFITGWDKPTEAVRKHLAETRQIDLKENQKCFFVSLVRKHYKVDPKDLKPKNEGILDQINNPNKELVEKIVIWNNINYNYVDPMTQKLAFANDKEIEISALASMLGYIAEKGVEYLEAERQTKKLQEKKQSKMEVTKKIKEVENIFKEVIQRKEDEGNVSQKLKITKEEG